MEKVVIKSKSVGAGHVVVALRGDAGTPELVNALRRVIRAENQRRKENGSGPVSYVIGCDKASISP